MCPTKATENGVAVESKKAKSADMDVIILDDEAEAAKVDQAFSILFQGGLTCCTYQVEMRTTMTRLLTFANSQ